MSIDYDSLTNRGEYFSAHYLSEELGAELRKNLFAAWTRREGDEHDPRRTPRESLRALRSTYLGADVREYFAAAAESDLDAAAGPEWRKRLAAWHQDVLRALGYDPAPTEITVHRAGKDYTISVAYTGEEVLALDCGWATNNDAALRADGADRLLTPLRLSGTEALETGAAAASWLFQTELGGPGGPRPRFILLLHGGVIVLADRQSWSEGRYLAANLDAALERNDRTQGGELATIAALFSHDMLRPGDNDRARMIDGLLALSAKNAVGVDSDLREGLHRSVEIIANEVLHRMAEPDNNVLPADIEDRRVPFARELTRECLRYLYRILFLLYAEARPELGILPADDDNYETGYSVSRLRELAARDEELVEEEARNGFHLFLSLDLLCNKVNYGHRRYGEEPGDDQPGDDEATRKQKADRRSEDLGLRFEALRSELFEPAAIRLIGRNLLDPRSDEETEPRWLDLRLRNSALHTVLRLLTLKKGKRGARGGFISYRNLGINQLGAVYEGLISYTGIIADQELCEVAKNGDPAQGSWLIPSHRQNHYPPKTLVHYTEDDARKGLRGVKKYERASFVYRLSGRERETSAAYYTPESLTKVTVELALKERLDQARDDNGEVVKTRAAELLALKICEPALGSGAFLNEAINQVAEEYLRRRQEELRTSIPAATVMTEKQKVKAYIALHNAYGVDLNATGVELAEVSLWLNTMHPGMLAPWFGLHLRRGNSLIGARRAVYTADDLTSPAKAWLKAKGGLGPTPLPFLRDAAPQPLPADAVHQFLLPSPGWAPIAGSSEAKKLGLGSLDQLRTWKRGILQRPARSTAHLDAAGNPKLHSTSKQPIRERASQFTRLRDAARRVEFLWSAVLKRMEISEREISRRITVWGADATDPEYRFIQQPERAVAKEKVLEDLFQAVDTPYWRLKLVMDAWCALWFWPADQVRLLDGTDDEYTAAPGPSGADSLNEFLTGQPASETAVTEPTEDPSLTVAVAPVPTPAAAPTFFRAMSLFPVDGEQTMIDDIGWGTETAEKIPAQRSRPKPAPKPKQPPRRRVIPLKDLDDWLDFLEAMLGTAEVPENTLLEAYSDLDAMKDFELGLPGFMGMDTSDPEARFPWLRVVRDIADKQGFLHWELDFALIFATRGGFDLQVGNPPWVQPRWNANSVFAEHEPWFELVQESSEDAKTQRQVALLAQPSIAAYVAGELVTTSGQLAYFASPQVYPLLAGTHPDLYRAFMCQVWAHTSSIGASGLLHPDTHFNGQKEGFLREEAYRRLRVHGEFVNSGQRFFARPVSDTLHFGVHVYGSPGEIHFDHLSWLVSVDALRFSRAADDTAEGPGIRFNNREFDERAHPARVIEVNRGLLSVWRRLLDEEDAPLEQAQLLFPVSTGETDAIEALADYPLRLAQLSPQISSGFHESSAKKLNLIDFNRVDPTTGREYAPSSWDEVILKGIQLGNASPIFKHHSANSNDPHGVDLVGLDSSYVPDTKYLKVPGRSASYYQALDRWIDLAELVRMRGDRDVVANTKAHIAATVRISESEVDPGRIDAILEAKSRRPYVDFYRVAWRRQVAPNTERALYSAIIPPGVAHVDAVHSLVVANRSWTASVAGFWASLPLDYFLRATGRGDLYVGSARAMPAPDSDHPLGPALILRTLRLNCLTDAYADLWAELFDPIWPTAEGWVLAWPGLPSLQNVGPKWQRDTPLRTERARRSALVEIDALVAVWLGMSADALIAAYKGRFPVLQKYEAVTWFDADGWKLAGNARTYGQRQTKETWKQFEAYQQHGGPVPEGYTEPFYQAKREEEMRAAHAVFQARLDAAIARGEWDPVERKMVTP